MALSKTRSWKGMKNYLNVASIKNGTCQGQKRKVNIARALPRPSHCG